MRGDVVSVVGSPEEAGGAQQECLQMAYHRARRHLVLLLYGRQLVLLDTQLGRPVGTVAADKSGSPFTQVSRRLGGRPAREAFVVSSHHPA